MSKEIPSAREGAGSDPNDCTLDGRCERRNNHGGMCGWGSHPCRYVKLDGSHCKGDHYTSNHELWAGKGAKIIAISTAIKDFMRKGDTPKQAVQHAQEATGVSLPRHQERFIIGALEAEVERLRKIELTQVPERELEDIMEKYKLS